ncbi:MAG: T9SS type A sorting domain-containing protein, partial [Chitinophagaceae bacterium]|nr:T9SS type A sorting domain-containing protein [Chitinophagaceae bacterium]
MKYKLLLLIIVLFLLKTLDIKAQVKTKVFEKDIPENLLPVKRSTGRELVISPPQNFFDKKALGKGQEGDKTGLYEIALPKTTIIDFMKEAEVSESNNLVIYSLNIKAKDALGLSLEFGDFELSENAVLSIFSEFELTDSITNNENNDQRQWGTRFYHGDLLHIVLKIPGEEAKRIRLFINKVFFAYRGFDRFGNPGTSASCNINVACPLGNGLQGVRNAVTIIQVAGGFATGVMVMNTCGTNIPYCLTGKHVVDIAGPVTNWKFQFFFYSTDCDSNVGYREDIQITGSTLKASYSNSDFALVQLNQIPPSNSNIHYAGWNRGAIQMWPGVIYLRGIHHPKGDVMKVSGSSALLIRNGGGSGYSPGAHWQVTWSQGITETSSSGSPLLDDNNRVIGQLHGGTSSCATPNAPDWYGSFDVSWTGGGTNATRLSNWLDPNNTGAILTNTTNISGLINLSGISISGGAGFCTSGSYSVTGLPAGGTVSWSATPAGYVNFSCTNCVTTTVSKAGSNSGTVTLTATVNTACGVVATVSKTLTVGTPPATITSVVQPSPSYGTIHVYFNVPPSGSPITSHKFYIDNVMVYSSSGVPSSPTILNGGSCGMHGVRLDLTSACGTGASNSFPYYKSCSGMFAVSPNPTNGQLSITVTGNDGSTQSVQSKTLSAASSSTNETPGKIYKILLTDVSGKKRKQFEYKTGVTTTVIDIADLPAGIYNIHAFDGKEWDSRKIQKQ